MKKVEFRYLSQEDIMSLQISWSEIVRQVTLGLQEDAQKTTECPPKRGVHSRPDSFIHEMPVYLKQMDAAGIKWVAGYPANRQKELPQITGIQIMNDPETGLPLCIMDCRWITAVRTAAVTAIVAKHCARPDSKKIAIIGAGVQGKMNLLALKAYGLPQLETCHICDIDKNALADYAERMPAQSGCAVIPFTEVAEAVQDVDMILTCTQKLHQPIIPAEAVKPGMLCCGLESARAWPEVVLHQKADKVITDHLGQALEYEKDGAFAGGLPEIYCLLGDLTVGKVGRETPEEIILAFNMGFAAEDIALGQYVYEQAVAKGVGTILPLMEKDF